MGPAGLVLPGRGWSLLWERFKGRPRVRLVDPEHLKAEELAELEAAAVDV
ncbi:MAG TPA: hypothetical protein VGG06_07265 [Thermoanaerobaculia bacterium]